MSDTCVICTLPLAGERIGAGDGTGQKFAHPSCYWRREAGQLRKALSEAEQWRVDVAEGLGYINHAEGQAGYEIADPRVIVAAFKGLEKERDEALARANARLLNPNIERRLRDDFAMAALPALIAKSGIISTFETTSFAYRIADAMLAARDRRG